MPFRPEARDCRGEGKGYSARTLATSTSKGDPIVDETGTCGRVEAVAPDFRGSNIRVRRLDVCTRAELVVGQENVLDA